MMENIAEYGVLPLILLAGFFFVLKMFVFHKHEETFKETHAKAKATLGSPEEEKRKRMMEARERQQQEIQKKSEEAAQALKERKAKELERKEAETFDPSYGRPRYLNEGPNPPGGTPKSASASNSASRQTPSSSSTSGRWNRGAGSSQDSACGVRFDPFSRNPRGGG